MTYLGRLPRNDPMWAYLRDDILPLVDGANGSDGTVAAPDFEVYRMPLSRRVYLYEDRAQRRKKRSFTARFARAAKNAEHRGRGRVQLRRRLASCSITDHRALSTGFSCGIMDKILLGMSNTRVLNGIDGNRNPDRG